MANSKPQLLATESKESGELGVESAGAAGSDGAEEGVFVGATLSGAFWGDSSGAKVKTAREPRERRRLNSRSSSPSQVA